MRVAYTIVTANYLAQAKTLSQSVLLFNPDVKFVIALLDKVNERFDVSYFEPAEIIEIESIGIDSFQQMAARYNIFELSNALKPFIADYLLHRHKETHCVLYFDSDILIYHSLEKIADILDENSIILCPHIFHPIPLDGLYTDERVILNSGIYNGGFFGVNNSEDAGKFINWWKERLKYFCFVDFANGMFVDQIWLNYVPLFFNKVYILNNLQCNVAYWNFHERYIEYKSGKYLVNNQPLIFFHFSGFDVHSPDSISKHQIRYAFKDMPVVKRLFEEYRTLVLNNNFEQLSKLECYYTRHETIPEQTPSPTVYSVFKRKVKNVLHAISS